MLFKDKTLGECTVKDVLDDPERFHGKYCGDPAEPSLPRDKAQVIQRQSDGWPWIKVYSHGFPDSSYSLKYTEEDYAELDAWGKDRANRAEALTAEFMKKREREGDDDNGAGDGSAEAKTETKKKELLKLDGLFLDELQKLPVEQRKWIVEGYILMYQLNGMFGDGATGKDYLLLQLGLAMTCGAQWLGLDVAQGRVLYFTGEDDVDEVRRREERITNHYVTCGGIYEPRPPDFKVFPMKGKNTVLGVWDQKLHQVRPTDVFEALKREVAEFKPLLVIIPNRVDSFSVNQNDDAHAKQCWRMLGSLCTEFGTTILMPGHASLRSMQSGDGSSGSVQWSNGCRLRTYLTRVKTKQDGVEVEDDPDLRVLQVMKTNYSRNGAYVGLHWQSFDGVHGGLFVPDMVQVQKPVLLEGETEAAAAQRMEGETFVEHDNIFLRMLDKYNAMESYVNTRLTSPKCYAPTVFSRDPDCPLKDKKGMRALQAAMSRLSERKVIKMVQYGYPSDDKWRLVRAVV